MDAPQKPPVFLDLTRIRLPVGAWASVLHRISGVLLAVSLPFCIYLLDRSLRNEVGFEQVAGLWQHPWVRAWAVLVLWATFHHALAGIRLLWVDVGVGLGYRWSRLTAWAVNAASVSSLVIGALLLLP